MKGVKQLSIEQEEAKKIYKEYKTALKTNKKNHITEHYQLERLYRYLAQGKAVIDIRECFKKAGYNKKGEPRLAIACVGYINNNITHNITCKRHSDGEVVFSLGATWVKKGRIRIQMEPLPLKPPELFYSKYPEINAIIPVIPPKYLPQVKDLKDYYLLWEVTDWSSKPKDPLLLRRISDWAFVVLAAWDLTPLERMLL
jgi:hypothetical protein